MAACLCSLLGSLLEFCLGHFLSWLLDIADTLARLSVSHVIKSGPVQAD